MCSSDLSSSRNARPVLRAAGLAPRFEVVVDGVVIADEGIAGKPDPAPFLLAANLAGVTADRALVIEDAESGVSAGAAGGFALVIGVDRVDAREALLAAGADVVQLDEPYMQARPEVAKQYAVKAINRALEGIDGETAVHLCFGYAHVVHTRPEGYSFLPELNDCVSKQISIETAQSGLDVKVLETLPGKKIILGVLDLSTNEIESPETVADRIRRALVVIGPERIVVAPDCGMKYMAREVAFGKLKAMCDGAEIVRGEL